MMDQLVGALIGIVATLLGVLATHLLIHTRETQREQKEFHDSMLLMRQELEGMLPLLNVSTTPHPITASAVDLLKSKGYLSRLPAVLLANLFSMYRDIDALNDEIKVMRQAA